MTSEEKETLHLNVDFLREAAEKLGAIPSIFICIRRSAEGEDLYTIAPPSMSAEMAADRLLACAREMLRGEFNCKSVEEMASLAKEMRKNAADHRPERN